MTAKRELVYRQMDEIRNEGLKGRYYEKQIRMFLSLSQQGDADGCPRPDESLLAFLERTLAPGGDFLLSSRLGHAGIQRAIDIAAKLRPIIHQSLL